MRPWSEHLAWCKQRALAYIPRHVKQAFASMISDIGKHPDGVGHIGVQLGMSLNLSGLLNDPEKMREWIEGFN